MAKYCQNCGKELNEEQDICLGCGTFINKTTHYKKKEKNKHVAYKIITGITMIIVGSCMLLGASSDVLYDYPLIVYSIPGLLGLTAGILNVNSRKRPNLLLVSGILMFIGALVNFLGIIDVSLFMILAIIFGIFNIIYSKDK